MFSGGVERDQWHETGEWKKRLKVTSATKLFFTIK